MPGRHAQGRAKDRSLAGKFEPLVEGHSHFAEEFRQKSHVFGAIGRPILLDVFDHSFEEILFCSVVLGSVFVLLGARVADARGHEAGNPMRTLDLPPETGTYTWKKGSKGCLDAVRRPAIMKRSGEAFRIRIGRAWVVWVCVNFKCAPALAGTAGAPAGAPVDT